MGPGVGSLQKVDKARTLPRGLRRERSPVPPRFSSRKEDPCRPSSPQACQMVYLCCFKPLSLRYSVSAAKGDEFRGFLSLWCVGDMQGQWSMGVWNPVQRAR